MPRANSGGRRWGGKEGSGGRQLEIVLPFFVILLVGAWGSGGVAKSSPNGVKSDEGWKCSIGKIQWMGGYAQLATWLAGYFPYIYIWTRIL
jgi:hypothetical protein